MFSKKGLITIGTDKAEEEQLLELALSAGADDMENTGSVYEITCDPNAYDELKKALTEREIPMEVAEISMVPQSMVPVSDSNTARKIISLMEALEDHDDVQNTFSNFDIPEDVMAEIS
jgi:transcriptional/translational regulatory protein YebC/TACO1